MRKNRFIRLLEFAENELGAEQSSWKCSELMDLQSLLEDYNHSKYDYDLCIAPILKKHGYTKKQWDDVLQAAGSFWWGPDSKMEDINEEIKSMIKSIVGYMPAQLMNSWSVFSGQLSSLMRQYPDGIVQRFKGTDGIFRYYLNEGGN